MSSGRSVIDRKRDHDQSSYTMLDVDLASKSIPVSLRLKCPVDVDVQYWRIQDVLRYCIDIQMTSIIILYNTLHEILITYLIMWILPLVGYLGMILGFGFLTLAIASGLYYLSELVEEHTVLAKKLLTRMIYVVCAVQVLLFLVDGLPFWLSVLAIGSHLVYLGNLRRFPIVKLSDPLFIASCVLVVVNHYLWFKHFSTPPPRSSASSRYDVSNLPTFTEISSFFGLCVWLTPFSLFVSLSASDLVLPTMGSEEPSSSGDKKGRQSMIKAVVDGFREWVTQVGGMFGWWKQGHDGF